MKKNLLTLCISGLVTLGALPGQAHDVAAAMADAADDLLSVLTPEQSAKASYKLTADERENWHFIPKPFEGEKKRGGIPLKELRPDQQHLAHALLSSGLSHSGYITALQIMSLEQVLWTMENQSPKRQPDMYYISIFGKPGSPAWGWRVEGHHLSVNFSIAHGKMISGTPCFFGSNPAEIREGPRKGLRVLADEEDIARDLVNSLSDQQKNAALISDKAPREVLTEANRKATSQGDKGVKFSDFGDHQKEVLGKLIDVYVHRLRPEIADSELKQIQDAGRDRIVFAWAGGTQKGDPHYYRVQGPTFLLEYANTQNNANHAHAVWRDFNGDFGRDILAEHYATHRSN